MPLRGLLNDVSKIEVMGGVYSKQISTLREILNTFIYGLQSVFVPSTNEMVGYIPQLEIFDTTFDSLILVFSLKEGILGVQGSLSP